MKYILIGLLALSACTMNKDTTENENNSINKINDIWVLTELNGNSFDNTSMRKHPTLEVHIAENRVVGNDGCNNFFGGLEKLTEDELKIGMLAGTKMMCPNIQLSNAFTTALQSTTSYKIEEMQLHLYDADGEEIVILKKVD
ncbi:MAG: META domain-containing protein [Bacteroidia bacterium]